jgi:probable phosphomutase (TIGR03848 family)
MATFFLIRHGLNDFVGNAIAGRKTGVHLNAAGKEQANRVAERLREAGISHIFSSPLERAKETAEPLARALKLEIEISDALLEIDFGDWTGKSFEELERLESWKKWNYFRSGNRVPNGETMSQVQARMVGEIERIRRKLPQGVVAVFSHGDPIKSVLAYYLGMPLDCMLRVETSPAGISEIVIDDWRVKVHRVNEHSE